jgi:hypothetical protein
LQRKIYFKKSGAKKNLFCFFGTSQKMLSQGSSLCSGKARNERRVLKAGVGIFPGDLSRACARNNLETASLLRTLYLLVVPAKENS